MEIIVTTHSRLPNKRFNDCGNCSEDSKKKNYPLYGFIHEQNMILDWFKFPSKLI